MLARPLLSIFLPLPAVVPVAAQLSVTGSVVDELGEPQAYANVVLVRAADTAFIAGAVTDVDGAFGIEGEGAGGDYRLRVSSIGYDDLYTPTLALVAGEPYRAGALALGAAAVDLATATVTADRALFERRVDRTIVNVAGQPTAVGQTALEVLERSPGVIVDRVGGAVSMLGKDGVQVMINGRLNYMPPDALLAYLAGIPASDIVRLELITTPPADLDAEGNAGYIDIVLRRLPDEGLRGTYALTAGAALPQEGTAGEVGGANVSATFRRGAVSLFGAASYTRNATPEASYLRRVIEGGTPEEDRTDLTFARDPVRDVVNARLGADFALSERTTLGLLTSGYVNRYEMTGVQRNRFGFATAPDTLLSTDVREDNDWQHLQIGVTLDHQLSEGNVSTGVDYLYYDNANPIAYDLTFGPVGGGAAFRQTAFASTKDSPFGILVGRVDYDRPLAGGKFSLGAKAVVSDFENDVALLRGGERDADFSTESVLDEWIGAAYAQWAGAAGELEVQAGLRYEFTDTQLDEAVAGRLVDRDYGNLFPNVSVGYPVTERIKLTAGFARRINRPAFTQLAPFVVFLDPRTSFGGNPALQPGISDNVELGAARGGLSLQLSYARVDSAIAAFQPVFDEDLGTQLIRPLNLREQTLYSATLGVPTKLAAWWSGRLNATYTYQEAVSLVDGETVVRDQGTFRLAGGQNFALPGELTLAFSGFFQGRNLNGYVETLPFGTLNIALARELPGGTLTLALDDAFDTLEFSNETDIPEQAFVSERGFDPSRPTLKLTWSAAFGNDRVRQLSRDSAAEERARVN